MQQTLNYALKKIDLADSPPDITVINPNWDKIDETLKALQDAINSGATDEELALLRQDLATHLADKTNPHGVTKSQVGLGNVDNVKQIPASEKGKAGGVAMLDANGKPLNADGSLAGGGLVKIHEIDLSSLSPSSLIDITGLEDYRRIIVKILGVEINAGARDIFVQYNNISAASEYCFTRTYKSTDNFEKDVRFRYYYSQTSIRSFDIEWELNNMSKHYVSKWHVVPYNSSKIPLDSSIGDGSLATERNERVSSIQFFLGAAQFVSGIVEVWGEPI